MSNHFIFLDDRWWDNPPCDCCLGGLVEVYNCVSHEEPSHSCDSLEDIEKTLIYVVSGVNVWNMEFNTWEDEEKFIKDKLIEFGITYEIKEA